MLITIFRSDTLGKINCANDIEVCLNLPSLKGFEVRFCWKLARLGLVSSLF